MYIQKINYKLQWDVTDFYWWDKKLILELGLN